MVKAAMRTVEAKVKLVDNAIMADCQPMGSKGCASMKVRKQWSAFRREWRRFQEDNKSYWGRLYGTWDKVQDYARRVNVWIRRSEKYGVIKGDVLKVEKGMDWTGLMWGAVALLGLALYARR